MNENIAERLWAKTPEQQFLNKLEHVFEFAPRVAEAILQEAKDCRWARHLIAKYPDLAHMHIVHCMQIMHIKHCKHVMLIMQIMTNVMSNADKCHYCR